jgi:hypothetical integral membrane protein (TIGR02206 family)
MPNGVPFFGIVHLAIIGMVPALAAILAIAQLRFAPRSRVIRFGLAILLCVTSVSYYANFAMHGSRMFPNHMPLELCDDSLWLVIAALLTLKPAIFDVAYYWALAGASMSLLTPNMVNPPAFIAIQYFADHGLIVVATLYLVWSRQARPRPGSVARAMVALNVVAAFVGTFDYFFKTDYMFLRAKPPTASLLDILGPWPWYILSCEGVGTGLFLLLYLPFWKSRSAAGSSLESREDYQTQDPTSS